ncbi:hypothetical protein FIBSPDRAFT_870244 [Athelia psychrophila]|uniref:Uncharacterized protein n=1 Tax=Athelia psychrophila TaxID=1759441 RepID=A0A166BAR7_9AGAM|nr:hypothetical protein FIBSPDRAFT_870244 [Fibularhizoctonia sp. CBS 109695]
MMVLGGYWVSLLELRKLAKNLDMDLGEDNIPNTGHYGRYINNWLCDNIPDNIPEFKAAGIDWPRKSMQFGVIFISKVAAKEYFVPLEENADDILVKGWLQRGGADVVQWATLEDPRGLAYGGTRPDKRTYTYRQVRILNSKGGEYV